MKRNILILSNREIYISNIFLNKKLDMCFSYTDINTFFKIIRRIWHFFHIGNFDIWYDFKDKKVDLYDTILIFECIYPIDVIKYIRRRNKNCRIIYWLWNPVSALGKSFMYNKYKEFFCLLEKRYNTDLNFEIWSFDKNDCKKYNLQYNNQVAYKITMQEQQIKYDFFFCGKDKDRLEKIKMLKNKLSNNKFKILVFPDKRKHYNDKDKQYMLSKKLAYSKIVEYINQSKCIIDIVQTGQAGLTWRPLEAMFYKKKLLTNYLDIKKYDFYDENNIFILGIDEIEKMNAFLEQPYKEISPQIIERYLADGWLNNFLRNE